MMREFCPLLRDNLLTCSRFDRGGDERGVWSGRDVW